MFKDSRWINFLGGANIIFTLVLLLLLGIVIFVFRALDFIFLPLLVISSNILIPMLIALLLYYTLLPFVDYLEKHKVNRTIGTILVFVMIIVIISILMAIAFPTIYKQAINLVEAFPELLDASLRTIEEWLAVLPFGATLGEVFASAEEAVNNVSAFLMTFLQNSLSSITGIVTNVVNIVMTIVLIPIILFFLLKDANAFYAHFIGLVPPIWREDFSEITEEINIQVGSYVKGQLLVAFLNGVMMFIGFAVIGLEFSGVLAIIGGVASIIPYIGAFITFFPALIIAFMASGFMVIKLIIAWIIIQFVQGNLLEPAIMGTSLKVHPLTIILVLLVMGDLFGIIGLIFGIPFYAILKVFLKYFFRLFKRHYNKYFGDLAGAYEVNSRSQILLDKQTEDKLKK